MIAKPLPEPLPPEDNQKTAGTTTIAEYANIKREKKRRFVSADDFLLPASGMAHDNNSESAVHEQLKVCPVTRNTINRISNTVEEKGLYQIQAQWPRVRDWDIYVLSSLAVPRIVELFTWAFENGYGADASVGRGKINVKPGSLCPVTPKRNGTKYLALGVFAGGPGCGLTGLRADVFVRSGKIGGAFASSLSPYKKQVLLYDEGAVFTSDKPLEYAGKLLTQMHGEDSRICQAAFAPVIPV
jgi:CRISPR-associated protein Csm4